MERSGCFLFLGTSKSVLVSMTTDTRPRLAKVGVFDGYVDQGTLFHEYQVLNTLI